MKILLAVDGSAYTKKMLAYLATHELLSTRNDYTAFNVQLMLPPQARAALGRSQVAQYYAEEAQRVLAPVARFLKRHGIEATCTSQIGHPGELIAKLAEDDRFDLIVMGSHGHGMLSNLVMGSIANRVLAGCKVPVLLVR